MGRTVTPGSASDNDALMLGRVWIGTHQGEHPVGIVRARGPNFLPVNGEEFAIVDRAGLQAR